MRPTTGGTFRVLGRPYDPEELLLVEVETNDPLSVQTIGGDEALTDTVESLRPGYLVEATLEWVDDGKAVFAKLDVVERTLIEFVEGATNIFEAAQETWQEALANGDAINSQVTLSTDNEPNGVVYTFAEQEGERDIWEEFRTGALPLEPLIQRLSEYDEAEREVFVIRPANEPFVLVYLTLRKNGVLADTVRDTYDCPRPSEADDEDAIADGV